MGLQTYQLVAGDWIGLERIINDLTGRVVSQTMGPTSSPTFAGLILTGLSGVLQATAGVLSGDADHNSLGNIQGGTTDEYYHLTSAEHTAIGGFLSEEVDPVFAGVLAGLTPDRLIYGGAAGALTSVSNLASWIAGTSNQITVTDDTDGTVTLSFPDDFRVGNFQVQQSAGKYSFGILNPSYTDLFVNAVATTRFNTAFDLLGSFDILGVDNGTQKATLTCDATGDLSITTTGGDIDFGDENLTTSGLIGGVTISGGNITTAAGTITSQTLVCETITDGVSSDNISIAPDGVLTLSPGGNLVLKSFTGLLKGTSGVVSAITATTSADYLGGDFAVHTLNQAAVAGLTTASTPSFAGLISGVDAATNTAGSLKLWSAGTNNYSTTFTAGTQTGNASYTLPVASSDGLLKNSSGTLSWGVANTDYDNCWTQIDDPSYVVTPRQAEYGVRATGSIQSTICVDAANGFRIIDPGNYEPIYNGVTQNIPFMTTGFAMKTLVVKGGIIVEVTTP